MATGCLNGNEQMGEGWSDFFALVFTHDGKPSNSGRAGLGPYIRFTGIDGAGIRPTRVFDRHVDQSDDLRHHSRPEPSSFHTASATPGRRCCGRCIGT